MKIKLHPYRLEFLFPFRIAHGIRTHTDALFIELELDGVTAFGEATFPPYLPFTAQQAMDALRAITLTEMVDSQGIIDPSISLSAYRHIPPPALAALDMALWTLKAKLEATNIRSLLGITEAFSPPRSYTISMCDKAEMSQRISAGRALGYELFKLKLNGSDDRQMLDDFRSMASGPFAIDANQSWTISEDTVAFAQQLERQGCVLIEQPFGKDDLADALTLKQAIHIPVIADESCQIPGDEERMVPYFSGINIKLQKCGGISPAFQMIQNAKAQGMKILIGCMSESIIGCSAGEVLSPLCDWNDLDGAALIKEVPFRN